MSLLATWQHREGNGLPILDLATDPCGRDQIQVALRQLQVDDGEIPSLMGCR
jgi:hypothetical protein